MRSTHLPPKSNFYLMPFIFMGALASICIQDLAAQVVPEGTTNNSCLVFSVRETQTAVGYEPRASSETGLIIFGPQRSETFANNFEPGSIDLAVRDTKSYRFYPSSDKKTNYFEPSAPTIKVVGLLNMAGPNVSKPSYLLTFATPIDTPFLRNDDPIGKASLLAPIKGSAPIWISKNLSAGRAYYDINADMDFDQNGNATSPYRFLGQDNAARRATLYKSLDTYKLNPILCEMVKGKDLDGAVSAIEAWFQTKAGGNRLLDPSTQ